MKKKVLVVDDNKTFLKVAEAFLKAMEYNVLTASSGEKALEMADSRSPDLMVLDIVMGGKNGLQVCRELKQKEKTRDIKIIIVSGSIDEIEKSFDYGADDCMIKPVDWNKLSEKLSKL